ncbi:outer membrane protein assembly factor BamE [Paraphotobacterium marinum]|nr:outer membrane protein assembly factor BamE [Paraphotobacterium marinum]
MKIRRKNILHIRRRRTWYYVSNKKNIQIDDSQQNIKLFLEDDAWIRL